MANTTRSIEGASFAVWLLFPRRNGTINTLCNNGNPSDLMQDIVDHEL